MCFIAIFESNAILSSHVGHVQENYSSAAPLHREQSRIQYTDRKLFKSILSKTGDLGCDTAGCDPKQSPSDLKNKEDEGASHQFWSSLAYLDTSLPAPRHRLSADLFYLTLVKTRPS